MTQYTIKFDSGTMIFENSEEFNYFLSKFNDRLTKFISLIDKNIHQKFISLVCGREIFFIWFFKERKDYIRFLSEFTSTEFVTLTIKLGWKATNRHSNEI